MLPMCLHHLLLALPRQKRCSEGIWLSFLEAAMVQLASWNPAPAYLAIAHLSLLQYVYMIAIPLFLSQNMNNAACLSVLSLS